MTTQFSTNNMQCTINVFKDVDLPTFKDTNAKSTSETLTYNNRLMFTYHSNNTFSHEKIAYAVSTDDANRPHILTIKNIEDDGEESEEIKTIEHINKIPDKNIKSFFIRSIVAFPLIYMDFFNTDLAGFLYYNHQLSMTSRQQIFLFLFEALTYIRSDGKCFTDIKVDQVLLRPHDKDRGELYYNIVNCDGVKYDIVVADLDFNDCDEDDYMYTYKIPKYAAKYTDDANYIEKQLLWSFGVTCLELFGFELPSGSISKHYIKSTVSKLKILPINNKIVKIVLDSLNPKVLSWEELIKTYRTLDTPFTYNHKHLS